MERPKTEEESAQTPCLVAYCGTCGKLIACAVNDEEYRKQAAKAAAKWIRDGLRVQTISVAEVRSGEWCDCKKEKRK
jgi:hypothetical protein